MPKKTPDSGKGKQLWQKQDLDSINWKRKPNPFQCSLQEAKEGTSRSYLGHHGYNGCDLAFAIKYEHEL